MGSTDTQRAPPSATRLEDRGLLVREERPYLHSVGHCYRCHSEIEPWLAGLQWFVKVSGLRGPAKEAAAGRARRDSRPSAGSGPS